MAVHVPLIVFDAFESCLEFRIGEQDQSREMLDEHNANLTKVRCLGRAKDAPTKQTMGENASLQQARSKNITIYMEGLRDTQETVHDWKLGIDRGDATLPNAASCSVVEPCT